MLGRLVFRQWPCFIILGESIHNLVSCFPNSEHGPETSIRRFRKKRKAISSEQRQKKDIGCFRIYIYIYIGYDILPSSVGITINFLQGSLFKQPEFNGNGQGFWIVDDRPPPKVPRSPDFGCYWVDCSWRCVEIVPYQCDLNRNPMGWHLTLNVWNIYLHLGFWCKCR